MGRVLKNRYSEHHVFEEESKEIQRRRRIAFDDDHETGDDQETVGLAISGGGVRSGALGLGFIQALIKRGIMPYVDYMSTISGGGYVGAFLSSYSLTLPPGVPRKSQSVDVNEEPSAPQSLQPAEQPFDNHRISQIVHGGNQLRFLGSFLNRAFLGSVLILGVISSALIFSTNLIAYCHQWVNYESFRFFINPLGFDSDVTAAFFPTVICVLLWLLAWLFSFVRRGGNTTGAFAKPFLLAAIVTLMTGFALLLGTGDISLGHFAHWMGIISEEVSPERLTRPLVIIVSIAICVALLPYLKPSVLIESGKSKRIVGRVGLWAVTRILILGVPFLLLVFAARENVSGFNSDRYHLLLKQQEISEWKKWGVLSPLWEQVLSSPPSDLIGKRINKFAMKAGPTEGDNHILTALSKLERYQAFEHALVIPKCNKSLEDTEVIHVRALREQFSRLRQSSAEVDERQREVGSMLAAWGSLSRLPMQWLAGEFERNNLVRMMRSRDKVSRQKSVMLYYVNCCLINPRFFQHVELPSNRSSVDLSRFAKLRKRADALSSLIDKRKLTLNNEYDKQLLKEVIKTNRQLLELYYPGALRSPATVFWGVVGLHDQTFRLSVMFYAGFVFLVLGLLVDLNSTSIHQEYAGRLANAWIVHETNDRLKIPLTKLDTVSRGYPYHLISGSAYFPGRRKRNSRAEPFDYFLFSNRFCGSTRTKYVKTKDFMNSRYSLEEAMAVSGAATSILHLTSNPLLMLLLLVLNVRLGQWIENPGFRPKVSNTLGVLINRYLPISPIRVLLSMTQRAERRSLCFVADGGFFDNLGVDPLLRRRCRLVIALDAGSDAKSEFTDFTKLLRNARTKHGIEFTSLADESNLPLESVSIDQQTSLSESHFFGAQIHYPDRDEPGLLLYFKTSMTGDESDELIKFQQQSEFPNDPTIDQAFSNARFESYRMLGEHMCESFAKQLNSRKLDQKEDRLSHDELVRVMQQVLVSTELNLPSMKPKTGRVPNPAKARVIRKLRRAQPKPTSKKK
ncbi:Patatin-like phospholipase [Stieleria bergensis]|uniref:Patatin-like phospholipase n=1 Tax=Stieleria bergensis TaxID=2528025 RepID=A0A517T2S8_9BACT|nr:Patatin-like phospholipase [Planctomycetes bacterium SV_7m_r]